MLSVTVLALLWMIAFHFYMESKFDRLRSDLLLILGGRNGGGGLQAALSEIPPFYNPQPYSAPDSAGLLPTIAEIAYDAPENWTPSRATAGDGPVPAVLPAYEGDDVYAQYASFPRLNPSPI